MSIRFPTSFRLIALVFVCGMSSGTAVAEPQEADAEGFFLGAGVNGSFEDFESDNIFDFDDAVGLGIRGGYRFDEWIAAELQYEWSGTFDGDALSTELDLHYIGMNAKLYPLHTLVQPYLLVGAGLAYADLDTSIGSEDETAATFRFGAGVEIPVFDGLRVTLEAGYVMPTGDLDDFRYATVGTGIIWYFGNN
jgi:opacity protein-like surface antigen